MPTAETLLRTLPDGEDADVSSQLLDAEKQMLEMVGRGASLEDVLTVLSLTVERHLGNDALTSVLVLDDQNRLRHGAAPSLPETYNKAIDGLLIGPEVGSCGTAAYHRKLVAVSDIFTDPLWANFKELAGAHGLRACWSTPIEGAKGKVLGTFAIYHRTPRTPTQQDLRFIDRIAVIARVAIEWHMAERDRRALVDAARKAQFEAEAERSTLREFIMQAPALLCLLRGPQHVFEVANPRYLELAGHRPLLGKSVREAFPEVAGQGFFELLDNVYRTGEPFVGKEMPVELQDPTGKVRRGIFNFVYQPTRGADGAVNGIAVYANEVTELVETRQRISDALDSERAARAAVEASQALFRTLFDAMPQLGWTATADGSIDFYNRGWYEYTGTTFEQMQGWGWKSVHDPDMLPRVIERWQHSLNTGTPFEMEFPLRRHDGVFRWFLTRVNPLRDADGKIVRWVGINTDVDDLRAARALAEEVAAEARETERQIFALRAAKDEAERKLAALQSKSGT